MINILDANVYRSLLWLVGKKIRNALHLDLFFFFRSDWIKGLRLGIQPEVHLPHLISLKLSPTRLVKVITFGNRMSKRVFKRLYIGPNVLLHEIMMCDYIVESLTSSVSFSFLVNTISSEINMNCQMIHKFSMEMAMAPLKTE